MTDSISQIFKPYISRCEMSYARLKDEKLDVLDPFSKELVTVTHEPMFRKVNCDDDGFIVKSRFMGGGLKHGDPVIIVGHNCEGVIICDDCTSITGDYFVVIHPVLSHIAIDGKFLNLEECDEDGKNPPV